MNDKVKQRKVPNKALKILNIEQKLSQPILNIGAFEKYVR